MKLLAIVFMLAASCAFAQMKIQNGNMTVNLNSEPLSKVLETIKQQTGMKVSIEANADSQAVSANFANLPVASGIKKILEGTGINYVVVAEEGGQPTALFIGSSLNPGAATQGANNMPNRGVVTPVAPLPPMPTPPDIRTGQPAEMRRGQKKNNSPAVTIPTGGGFVPNTDPSGKSQQAVPPNPQNPDDEQQAVEDDEQQNPDEQRK